MIHVSHRLFGLALGLTAVSASAVSPNIRQEAQDSLVNNQQIMVMGHNYTLSKDSVRSLIEAFYLDQFRNYQDPAAPYFMFMSQDGNMAMGVGGEAKMRAFYDPGNSMPGDAFTPYNVPVGRTPLNRNKFGTTPSGTAIFLRMIGRNTRVGSYQLYILAKFDGYNGQDFKLNKAYATINDWTVGYASSTFSDGQAVAPTVDANSSTMTMDFTTLLVRWTHEFKHGITAAASIETPNKTLPNDDPSIGVRSDIAPNFSAMIQYQWSKNQHVRLSAITRVLPYRDMITGKNHSPMGYGFQLSTVFNPTRALTVYGIGNIGRSYSNIGGDFLMGQYDLEVNPEAPGHLRTVPSWSYFLGLGYHFSYRFSTSVTVGQARNMLSAPREADSYRGGLYAACNVFYKITPRIIVGAEANVGRRENYDRDRGWGRRIGAMCEFSF